MNKWQSRNERNESLLKSTFQFTNKQAPIVMADVNYWTFGDNSRLIPDDYYTSPRSAFNYQNNKLETHFNEFPEDSYIPFLHPWFGTGVLASAFGVNIICNPKADPATDAAILKTFEDIDSLALPEAGKSGYMARVVDTMNYFMEHSQLPISVTDCQGPLATAFQIAGYDNLCYWMQDDPERIHLLMDKISDALIAWVEFQKKLTGQPIDGGSFPLGVKLPLGAGGVWISDDDSVIMSSDLYNEFVRPYNEKVLLHFGGGCIHYCGDSTQNINNYINTKGVTAINNFNLDNMTAAAKIRRALREEGIVYMACDFAPLDHRIDDYYRELAQAMDGPEGLIIASYPAPAIGLEKGGYAAVERDRNELSRQVYRSINKYFR